MSAEGSVTFSTAIVEPDVNRRSADYAPSVWGDHFLSYATDFMESNVDKVEHKKLKEEVKRELMANISKPSQTLDFIDAIQRLGISYHFEVEIDEILREMYNSHCDFNNGDMKNQVRAYYLESIWFHQKHTPTMEEYMAVAMVSSGYAMLAATSFIGMGSVVTKDSFEWLFSGPKILKASEIIARLMDDIVSHKVVMVPLLLE
ncbi:hypothetical protein SADUNF_Sadunf16G0277800 [Salix dunnii]|uniref:Terpene synthase metal-binding domain-containing protein n=1 Tax=Salix dunnii TaxID=1413687 RepID=A0A835JGS8_9ROSI|nr:hypothetical protein SADUNF_Sadunf16G0277800 [Salix dunnii]